MALIKCIECGKEISDKAERCIHCGCPITISVENNNQLNSSDSVENNNQSDSSNSEENNHPSDSLETPMSEEQKRLFDLYVSAKNCPNCGAQYKPGSKFCAKCGAPKSLNGQGRNLNGASYPFQKSVTSSPYMQSTYVPSESVSQPRCTALGIISILFAVIGFFILPIVFNVIGLIFAIITVASNPKEEKEWIKPIWMYTNKARGIGIAALMLNIIGIILMIFNMVNYSTMFSGMF